MHILLIGVSLMKGIQKKFCTLVVSLVGAYALSSPIHAFASGPEIQLQCGIGVNGESAGLVVDKSFPLQPCSRSSFEKFERYSLSSCSGEKTELGSVNIQLGDQMLPITINGDIEISSRIRRATFSRLDAVYLELATSDGDQTSILDSSGFRIAPGTFRKQQDALVWMNPRHSDQLSLEAYCFVRVEQGQSSYVP